MGRALQEKSDRVLVNMEQLGAQTVRDLISSGQWPANYSALAKEWLHQKEMEKGDHKAANGEAQMLVARESNELAHAAREAAADAGKRAEDAHAIARDAKNIACAASASADRRARTARTAKAIAIAALAAALIAIAIPIASLFIRWPPALQTLLNIMWQR